jgi:hypothetical protein
VITGTLPVMCYAARMAGHRNANGILIFDYPEFAKTLRDRVRERAASLAAEAGVTIEHIAKLHVRKEDVVARVLVQRGDRPGLVHVISAMEACDAYKPWHDKQTHKTFVRPDSGQCLHYYFYFQDVKFGLVYLRVPTWAPFGLKFYGNGHSWGRLRIRAKSGHKGIAGQIPSWQRRLALQSNSLTKLGIGSTADNSPASGNGSADSGQECT